MMLDLHRFYSLGELGGVPKDGNLLPQHNLAAQFHYRHADLAVIMGDFPDTDINRTDLPLNQA